mgnify:CR=1 FL=1
MSEFIYRNDIGYSVRVNLNTTLLLPIQLTEYTIYISLFHYLLNNVYIVVKHFPPNSVLCTMIEYNVP